MVKGRQMLSLACGVVSVWTVSLTAAAQDEGESEPDTTQQSEEDSDDRQESDQVSTREPGPPWVLGRPYVDPALGAVVFSDGAGGVTGLAALGASATLPFRQDIDDGARWGGEGGGRGARCGRVAVWVVCRREGGRAVGAVGGRCGFAGAGCVWEGRVVGGVGWALAGWALYDVVT